MKQLRGFGKNGNGNGNGNGVPDAVKDNPQFLNAMQKYGNMNEDALVESLLAQIRTAQENGTYNPAQMAGYVNMLSPHLSPAQREKLTNIMRIIESENA